jgi:hypothetical protein
MAATAKNSLSILVSPTSPFNNRVHPTHSLNKNLFKTSASLGPKASVAQLGRAPASYAKGTAGGRGFKPRPGLLGNVE